jgi:hypothetical protein
MALRRRTRTRRSAPALFLLGLCAFVLCTSSPASAASLVAKDGRIHACYKAKGKGKGTLRVVRNGKVRCPKRWKKVAWYASGPGGPQGEAGSPGGSGQPGGSGSTGLSGPAGATVVKGLEDKISELLTKVQSLEAILKGVTNAELLAAIANSEALCTQVSTLTKQLNMVEEALGGLSLNTVLAVVLQIPALPGALPTFACPTP